MRDKITKTNLHKTDCSPFQCHVLFMSYLFMQGSIGTLDRCKVIFYVLLLSCYGKLYLMLMVKTKREIFKIDWGCKLQHNHWCKVLTVTWKKNPGCYDYHLGHVDLQHMNEEKDLGVMITSKLMREPQVLMVSAEANKLLSLLRYTCPMLTDVKVRRFLYVYGTS